MADAGNVAQNAAGDRAIGTFRLTRRFGAFTAVERVNLVVPYGGIFGLLGPNGAGKSTLIKMLTTLMQPSDGTARIAGFDIVQALAEIRKRIGYVPQLLSADGALPGIENLALSARLYGIPRAELKPRVAEALRYMGWPFSARCSARCAGFLPARSAT